MNKTPMLVQVYPDHHCPHCGEWLNIQMDELAIWGDERFNPSDGTLWVCNECGQFYIVLAKGVSEENNG